MKDLPAGLYDLLHTKQLHIRLEKAGLLDRAVWSKFEPEELKNHLAIPLAREIAQFISENVVGKKSSEFEQALNYAFESPAIWLSLLESIRPVSTELLQQITENWGQIPVFSNISINWDLTPKYPKWLMNVKSLASK